MDISEISNPEYVEVDAGTRLAKVRSIFERENPKGIIVTRDGEYAGVIGERQLVRSRVDDDSKAETLLKASRQKTSAPKVDRHEDIRETARMLVEGGTKVAPVYEGEKRYGIITADAILEAVLDSLDAITVEQIYSDDVITISEKDKLGKVINQLREHGISRLPVVGEDGKLAGVVTTHDIVEFAVREEDRQGRADRRGDIDRMLDLPVYDIMSEPVLTSHPGETVDVATERMLENDVGGLVVTATESGADVVGVLTKTDVLRALSYTEQQQMDVQITNIDLLDDLSREQVVADLTEVVDKYQDMQVLHAHVRFHEHKEKLRGTPLIRTDIRLRTNEGQISASGEGYGADHAFHVALDRLERRVLELKGTISDEEYRGQLLRKLGEL
ncbi:MAG: CBS domain-containing protein [Haloferacaceae archaeon]